MRAIPGELYNTILHDPKLRDPRGYIIPSDQADFATATEFVNALLKNGIAIHRATAAFQVAGKSYPAGSYVVKAAQARGDFQVLAERQRRALRVHLGSDVRAGLASLQAAITRALA